MARRTIHLRIHLRSFSILLQLNIFKPKLVVRSGCSELGHGCLLSLPTMASVLLIDKRALRTVWRNRFLYLALLVR